MKRGREVYMYMIEPQLPWHVHVHVHIHLYMYMNMYVYV